MSLEAMAWAWAQQLPASQKLTLLAIADVANAPNGFTYWAGLQRLAEMQGCTYDQISRNIRDLIAGGYLERLTSGSNRKTKYRLLLDSTVLSNQAGGDATVLLNPDSTALSNPIPNSSINTREPNSSVAPAGATNRNSTWDQLVDIFGDPGVANRTLYGKITRQLDEWEATPETIRTAAAIIVNEWGKQYLTPASLLKHYQWALNVGAVDVEAARRQQAQHDLETEIAKRKHRRELPG